MRWWRGDLHMHTVHSDGNWTIAEQISSALNSGLDFISITDHNTASHHAEIDRLRANAPQLLMLRGEEINVVMTPISALRFVTKRRQFSL